MSLALSSVMVKCAGLRSCLRLSGANVLGGRQSSGGVMGAKVRRNCMGCDASVDIDGEVQLRPKRHRASCPCRQVHARTDADHRSGFPAHLGRKASKRSLVMPSMSKEA